MLIAAAPPNITPMMNIIAAAAFAPTADSRNMPRLFRIPLCSRIQSIHFVAFGKYAGSFGKIFPKFDFHTCSDISNKTRKKIQIVKIN